MYDLVVVGCGATGMASAILSARDGKKVAIIERQDSCGKKILASGNGHCNIANINISSKDFYATNKSFLNEFLNGFSIKDVIEFFRSIGLELMAKDDGKLYPASYQAKSVVELLKAELKRLKVDIFFNATNLSISSKNSVFELKFNNKKISSKALLVATGSAAAPQLGGNSSGLEIAKSFGHRVFSFLPALVPLTSSDAICKNLSGTKVYAKVKVLINNKEVTSTTQDLLFTKYGVSGLSILDISKDAVLALNQNLDVAVEVDFFPALNRASLLEYLKNRVDKKRALSLPLWLGGVMNLKIATYLLKKLNLSTLSEKDLNSKILKEITHSLKSTKIKIDGFREFKYAEVALGGVDLAQIDPKTLESKLVKKLYFSGEILNLIGKRGGYNFYIAWVGAFRVWRNL